MNLQTNIPFDFNNVKDKQYKEVEIKQSPIIHNETYQLEQSPIINNSSKYTYTNTNTNFFTLFIIWLMIYFILYFIISLILSLETLFFIFNTIDFIFIIVIIYYVLFGITLNNLQFIKYIWNTIKPFFINSSYLIYLLIFILILQLFLFLFKNKFDISKPIILSLIEGFLYVFFIIILIIDVLQLAFKIPLINILENDIDRQYNTITPDINTNLNTSNCVNINKFKDPQAIRSFYDLQVNNYKSMKNYYNNSPKILSNNINYKPTIENPYINGVPDNITNLSNIPKSQLDKNINITLKYWMDNSSNIMKQFHK